MFQNVSLIGFNLRAEDYLIKLLKDNFVQINIICVDEFNVKETDGIISLTAKDNKHPFEISKMLGHTSIKTTFDVYGHLFN